MTALVTQPKPASEIAALFDATGDREATWKTLWESHAHTCFRLALRILRSKADAWAVVNASWLKASEVLTDEIRDFGAWVATITRHEAIDFLRKGQRRAAREGRLEAWHHSGLQTTTDPVEKAAADEALEAVLDSGKLTKDERRAFLLRALGGHQYEEIAKIMDRPQNSISVYIHRARKKLQESPRIKRLLIPLVVGVAWFLGGGVLL